MKTAVSLFLVFACWTTASAQVAVDESTAPVRGRFVTKELKVVASIDQQVATVTVEQTIVNATDGDLEVRWLFPVPMGATVTKASMWVGDKELAAELLPADKAREVYFGHVRSKRDPALLEYVGGGLVRTSVFPVGRGEERKLKVTYVETLRAEAGLLQLSFPFSTLKHSARPASASIEVSIATRDAVATVYSPTHDVVVTKGDARHAKATWSAAAVQKPADFDLFFSTADADLGVSLLTYRPDPAQAGYFLLFASPAVETDPKKVEPKDIVFVLDRSGSMKGDKKIEQARDALVFCLRALNDQDRFGLVAFSDRVERHSERLLEYTSENKEKAIRWIEQTEAQGGTDISAALKSALALHVPGDGRSKMVLFLTDGLATNGETETAKIVKSAVDANAASARIFAFGVGYDVNATLLDKLMRETNGDSAYIKPGENLEAKISAYYTKIQSPVLSSVAIDYGAITVREALPAKLPDLFKGGRIVVAGRYDGHGPATVTLKGTSQGQPRQFRYDLAFDEKTQGTARSFVAQLWATRRVGDLIDQVQLYGAKKELVEEIVRLSTRFGIITEYTAFLVDETSDPRNQEQAVERTEKNLKRLGDETGRAGVGQSMNKKDCQGADRQRENAWKNDQGETVEAKGCTRSGEKTFFAKKEDGKVVWRDLDVEGKPAEEIVFYSDAFFKMLENRPDLCKAIATMNADVVVKAGDKAVMLKK
jgi:Ca-activated chloride channel family protein